MSKRVGKRRENIIATMGHHKGKREEGPHTWCVWGGGQEEFGQAHGSLVDEGEKGGK